MSKRNVLAVMVVICMLGLIAQASTVTDDFNNNEGLNYTGWTEVGGTDLYRELNSRLEWYLGSNEIDHVTLNNTVLTTNDLDIQVDVGAQDGSGTIYIYFLYQDANNWYRLNSADTSFSKFEKCIGGVISNVGAAGSGVDIVAGQPLVHWQVLVDPTAGRLQFFSASTQILNISETIALSNGQVGLGGTGRRPVWDNFSVVAAGDPTPPAAPTGLTATGGNNSATLDWSDNTEPDSAGYNVYRSTTPGSYGAALATDVMQSAYTDNTAANGTAYYYVVTAMDTSGNESGNSNEASATPQVLMRYMERLNRGIVAVRKSSTSAFISWRLLGLDPASIGFNLYRSAGSGAAVKLNSSVLTGGTCYTDSSSFVSQEYTYYVKPVINNVEQDPSDSYVLAASTPVEPCIVVPLNSANTDQIRSVWVGDLNDDGEYEYVVDRLPPAELQNPDLGVANQKLEAYSRDGTRLWMMDLGPNSRNIDNIEPGSSTIDVGHWDGVTVYDLDSDGRAEVMIRTANGVTFGDGGQLVYPDNNVQFISVVDGLTGAERARAQIPTDYLSDGPMGAQMGIGYLNGVTPSIVASMKNRKDNGDFNMMICAWDFDGTSLTQQWKWLRGSQNCPDGHNLRIVDMDGDGMDEIGHIGFVLDSNGTLLYNLADSGVLHGDRWHIGKFDQNRPGLQGFGIQQNNPSGLHEYYYDAGTGEILWSYSGTVADMGRGEASDIDPRYPGFEVWSFDGVWNGPSGTQVSPTGTEPWPCIRLWWDGDELGESYNDGKIEEYDPYSTSTGRRVNRLVSTWNYETATDDDTKPMGCGDIFGDWREEAILTSTDYTKLVIFTTDIPTTRRIYTLPHNPAYRNCMTIKGYTQSHQVDYYLGFGMSTPPTPNIRLVSARFNPADIVSDGRVDFIDFAVLAAQWMNSPGVPSADIAPLGGDGVVNYSDLQVLCDNWLTIKEE